MSRNLSLFGLLALVGVLVAASSIPAAAEFFNCNQRPGQLLYSYTGTPDRYVRRQPHYSAPRSSQRYTTQQHRRRATYSNEARYWNGR
jgi:hypothetical protein